MVGHAESNIVIDSGSGILKIGLSGEDEPCHRFPVIFGQSRDIVLCRPIHKDDSGFICKEAQDRRNSIALEYPMNHGIVTNWDKMSEIWSFAMRMTCSKWEDRKVLFTEAPLTPISQRLRTAEIMFEKNKVEGLHFANSGVMALHSAGLTTGIVLEIGDGVTAAVPIYKGRALTKNTIRVDFAGRDLTKCLMKLLEGNMSNYWPGFEGEHQHSNTASTRFSVQEAKEEYCYVARDFQKEMAKEPKVRTFKVSSGNVITIGKERFCCPEALFQPALVGLSTGGLHEITCRAIESCDKDLRENMYENIILCGGTANMRRLASRLNKEITALAPKNANIKIVESVKAEICAWNGASILAATSLFKDMFVNKQKFEEVGPNVFATYNRHEE